MMNLPIRHVAMDASAGQMPVGSNLTFQAFGKLHDAIAALLLAAPRAASKSELFRRCRQLLSDSSMMLTATDFIPPEVAPPGASDYFQGYNLAQFGLFGFFRYATLNKLCGGLIRFVQRDPDSNPNLNMLLGDLLSPTKQGGLLPNMAISFPADFRREIAFKNFLVFRDIPDYEVPFDMHSYFQLRWTDEGIRSGNSESIDSTVARQVTDPSSGLDNLACFFWDTPLSDIVSGINAVKGVFDHSLIASPNSKSTLYLVNAKLADFKAVFSHVGTV